MVSRSIQHPYRVRFDEADIHGRLRPSGFLRFTQDMAWRHSEEGGFDRDWYDARSMHWLVRNIDLRLHVAVNQGETLLVSTTVTGWRHIWARRHTTFERDGATVADVNTDWVLLRDDGRPAPVPEEVAAYFSPATTFRRDRVVLPEPLAEATEATVRVRPIDVDPLGHMNNAAYLDVVDDAADRLPARPASVPGRYQVGYISPALPGSTVHVSCWAAAGRTVACRLRDADGNELTRALVSWPSA